MNPMSTNIPSSLIRNPTAAWQHITRLLPGGLLQSVMTSSSPVPLYVHISGDGTATQRSVALDALQMIPVLSIGPAISISNVLFVPLYVPTVTQLAALKLARVASTPSAVPTPHHQVVYLEWCKP